MSTVPEADVARRADDDGLEYEFDVSVVLPVYNEKGHLRAEIDRVRTALETSEYSFEIIVVDDGSNDGSGAALREIEGIRLIQFAAEPGERRGPQGGDPRRARPGGRLDRRRHDLPEQRDPAAGQGARRLGPGRRRPDLRAGHREVRPACRPSG